MLTLILTCVILLIGIPIKNATDTINDCQKTLMLNKDFNDTKKHLYTAIYILQELSLVIDEFKLLPPLLNMIEVPGYTMKYLIYRYSPKCNVDASEIFLDILLNDTLNGGKPFKILAIFAIVNDTELMTLANLMTPFSIPIIPFPNLDFTKVQYLQSIYHYYDNVIFISSQITNQRIRDYFLSFFTENLKFKLITIVFNSEDRIALENIQAITKTLELNSVCVDLLTVEFGQNFSERNIKLALERTPSNVFLIMIQNFDYGGQFINTLKQTTKTKSLVIVYILWKNPKQNLNTIFTLEKINPYVDILLIAEAVFNFHDSFIFYSMIALRNSLNQNTKVRLMISNSWNTLVTRNLPHKVSAALTLKTKKSLVDLIPEISKLLKGFFWLIFFTEKNNTLKTHRLSNYLIYADGTSEYTKVTSKNYTDIVNVSVICDINCTAGFTALNLISTCCWKCEPCQSGYFKEDIGQHKCKKCEDSLPNPNKTQCIPFSYQYFTISPEQNILVMTLSSVGCLYILTFLLIFLYYKSTPFVKSLNLPLSFIQIMFHLVLNCEFGFTILQQTCNLNLWQSIMGGYALKIVMSIYIIKTNQLITIFQSNTVIKKTVLFRLKEITLPAIYLTSNIFITTILVSELKIGYKIFEIQASLLRYKYCNLDTYFYFDVISLVTLSVICSIQAFRARKLPANYNETYYIFLGMFTTTILLLVSIPLNASFDKDGQKRFANSCIIYCTNIALISITYGYKIFIMIFQKERNTTESFQKILLKCMQEKVKKQTTKSI